MAKLSLSVLSHAHLVEPLRLFHPTYWAVYRKRDSGETCITCKSVTQYAANLKFSGRERGGTTDGILEA